MPKRHLRLLVESNGKSATPLNVRVVDAPLPEPGAVRGPVAYALFFGGGLRWLDTVPDPFEQRSAARPGEVEHHRTMLPQATFVIRVPLPDDELPADYEVALLRPSAETPRSLDGLRELVERDEDRRRLGIGRIDLRGLDRLPEWRTLVVENRLQIGKRRGPE